MIVPKRFRAAHHAKRERYRRRPRDANDHGRSRSHSRGRHEFPVEIRISPLESSEGRSIVGIVRDVTEQHRIERRQRQLVHDLGERVKELTALHAAGRILNEPGTPAELLAGIVNLLPAAWQYPDITHAHIAIGGIDVRTDGFEATPWLQRAEFKTMDGQAGIIEVAYSEVRPHATEGPFLAEERYLIQSLAGMLRAYFERRQAEEHRVNLVHAEAARVQAQEANAAKDQFLATVSHELRSPLNVMIGWTQMLRAGHISPEAASRGFDVLERSVRLQAKLIDDLLDVSRISVGKLRIEKRPVDLALLPRLPLTRRAQQRKPRR